MSKISTRGLIGVVNYKDGKFFNVRFVYNHSDSYPSGLGNRIVERLKKRDYEKFKQEILSGKFTNENESIDMGWIIYLFHEWVYILDFNKKKVYVFESISRLDDIREIEEKFYDLASYLNNGNLRFVIDFNFDDDVYIEDYYSVGYKFIINGKEHIFIEDYYDYNYKLNELYETIINVINIEDEDKVIYNELKEFVEKLINKYKLIKEL